MKGALAVFVLIRWPLVWSPSDSREIFRRSVCEPWSRLLVRGDIAMI